MSTPDFDRLLDQFAAAGLGAAADGLKKVKPKSRIEEILLGALADYVGRHGLEGWGILKSRLLNAAAGVPIDLDLSDLRAASDLLAVLQQREGEERDAALDAITRIGREVGAALGAILRGAVGAVIFLAVAIFAGDARGQVVPVEEPVTYSFGTPALEFRPDGEVRYAGHRLFVDASVYEDVRTFMRRAVHRADGAPAIGERRARWVALASIDETCPAVRVVRENCGTGDAGTCRGRVEFVLFPAQERPVISVANDPPHLVFGGGGDPRSVIVWWARRAAGCRRPRTVLVEA